MNPHQEYPFDLDDKEQQNSKKQTGQLNVPRRHLKEKLLPSSSPFYLSMQTSYQQKFRKCLIKRYVSSQKKEK